MKIDILTLFPEMFTAITESSMIGRAVESGILEFRITNIRDYTQDKHRKVDDTPFGGGVGMVMTAEPVFRAIDAIGGAGKKMIYMSPRGKILDYERIEALAKEEEMVILCGHYEGVDERILQHFRMEEISIGDYILTGGELPAMVLVDAVARMIPGVLGESISACEESVYSGLLEYPQYTKPREYAGLAVPEVLVSGNHEHIRLWNLEQSLLITKERRPDLLEKYLEKSAELAKKDRKVLKKIMEKADGQA